MLPTNENWRLTRLLVVPLSQLPMDDDEKMGLPPVIELIGLMEQAEAAMDAEGCLPAGPAELEAREAGFDAAAVAAVQSASVAESGQPLLTAAELMQRLLRTSTSPPVVSTAVAGAGAVAAAAAPAAPGAGGEPVLVQGLLKKNRPKGFRLIWQE